MCKVIGVKLGMEGLNLTLFFQFMKHCSFKNIFLILQTIGKQHTLTVWIYCHCEQKPYKLYIMLKKTLNQVYLYHKMV